MIDKRVFKWRTTPNEYRDVRWRIIAQQRRKQKVSVNSPWQLAGDPDEECSSSVAVRLICFAGRASLVDERLAGGSPLQCARRTYLLRRQL